MTDFFANSAFLGLGVYAVLIGQQNLNSGVQIVCVAVVLVLLHKIEQHLFNQTALMVNDQEEEGEYPQHPDIPLDLD